MTAGLVRHIRSAAALLSLTPLACAPCAGRDLGVVGPVYPIAEPDMLDQIRSVLEAKQASGELERLQREAQRRMRARVETPAPVAGLKRARAVREWDVDPSVRFDEPIVDGHGRVVVPAGTLANPLAVVRLTQVLLFIDGRDPDQLHAARSFIDNSTPGVILVLTAGSPASLSAQWRLPVYFDQGGRLVQRFGIHAVPASVTQAGLALRVREFPR